MKIISKNENNENKLEKEETKKPKPWTLASFKFLSQKDAPFRDHRNFCVFDGYLFWTTRRKKGTALHDGVGSSMFFFQVTAELQRMPIDNSASK